MLDEQDELLASVAEAAYASQQGYIIEPEPQLTTLESIDVAIHEIQPEVATASGRLRRIELLKLKDWYQARLATLKRAVYFAFIWRMFGASLPSEDLYSVIPGLVRECLWVSGGKISSGSHSFDVFRTKLPTLHAIAIVAPTGAANGRFKPLSRPPWLSLARDAKTLRNIANRVAGGV